MNVSDLLYCEQQQEYVSAWDTLKAKYPDATLEDASDDIHRWRFSVEGEIDETDYFMCLLSIGLPTCSFLVQMTMMDNSPESRERRKRWNDALEARKYEAQS